MEKLKKLKLKYSSTDWKNLTAKDFEGLTLETNKLLDQCNIGKELANDIKLNKPRFLNRIEAINNRKKENSQKLANLEFSKPSVEKLRTIVNKTINLYMDSVNLVLEFSNRETGTKD